MGPITKAVLAAKNPQEAIVALAEALDRIESKLDAAPPAAPDPWGEWGPPVENYPSEWEASPGERAAQAEFDDEGGTVTTFKPADADRQQRRRAWADEFITPNLGETLADAYVKGGPMWLDAYDHTYVMGLPAHAKLDMIADVKQDSLEDAKDMGRELLKDMDPGGAPGRFTNAEWA